MHPGERLADALFVANDEHTRQRITGSGRRHDQIVMFETAETSCIATTVAPLGLYSMDSCLEFAVSVPGLLHLVNPPAPEPG